MLGPWRTPIGPSVRTQPGDVEPRDAVGVPVWLSGPPAHAAGHVAAEQADPLLRRQRLHEQRGALGGGQRRVAPGVRAAAARGLGGAGGAEQEDRRQRGGRAHGDPHGAAQMT